MAKKFDIQWKKAQWLLYITKKISYSEYQIRIEFQQPVNNEKKEKEENNVNYVN